jgi:mannose-6-phosphate isomerase-like protein (cupin superfamily)|tara:strand:- start:2189 stop:2518 length:330 start_codon:yes stop_codon:yes gene_type:complete
MKFDIKDIGGIVAKQDERYIVKDNTTLKNLVVSSTFLEANKSTSGHRHAGQEEVYYFVSGKGQMELDHKIFDVNSGDVVLIEDNVFHKVHNTGDYGLYFVCVFDGRRAE